MRKVVIIYIFLFLALVGLHAQQCPTPTPLGATAIGLDSAFINWAGSSSVWEIELTAFQEPPTYLSTQTKPFLLTQLTQGTYYQYRIRSICGAISSPWSSPRAFRTLIDNDTNCALSLPIPNLSCQNLNDFKIKVQTSGTSLGTDIVLVAVETIIEHPYLDDLSLSIISPNGTEVQLTHHIGEEGDNYGNPADPTCTQVTRFEDSDCVADIANDLPPYIGTYQPEESFETINLSGENPTGQWTLKVCDSHLSDLGYLKHVRLIFEDQHCPGLTSIGLLEVGGQYVTIEWQSNQIDSIQHDLFELNNATLVTSKTSNQPIGNVTLSGLQPTTTYQLISTPYCGGIAGITNCLSITTDCADAWDYLNFDNQPTCSPQCLTTCSWTGLWQNATNDDNEWILYAGSTPSYNTGPTTDASGTGQYIYTETSSPCTIDGQAILESPCLSIQATNIGCGLSFDYHMKGSQMGSLSVEARTINTLNWDALWTLSGHQSDQWQNALIGLEDYTGEDIQIRFVSKRGGTTSDVALDNIKLYGQITELGQSPYLVYVDADEDGFGDSNLSMRTCADILPTGFSTIDGDCNDNNPAINPDAIDSPCNEIDENCNGLADDQLLDQPILDTLEYYCPNTNSIQLQTQNVATGNFYWTDHQDTLAGNTIQYPLDQNISNYTLTVWDSIQLHAGYSCQSPPQTIILRKAPTPRLAAPDTMWFCKESVIDLTALPIIDSTQITTAFEYYDSQVLIANPQAYIIHNPIDLNIHAASDLGCMDSITIQLETWDNLQASINGLDTIIFCQDETKILHVNSFGGEPPIQASWNNGFVGNQTLWTLSSSPQTLIATITDHNQCTDQDTVIGISVLDQVSNVQVTNIQDVSACGVNDGEISLQLNGGQPPYTIQSSGSLMNIWTTSQSAITLTNLPQGSITLTIFDQAGPNCGITLPALIIDAPSLMVNAIDINNTSCYGGNDGQITLTVSGTSPQYQWDDGHTQSSYTQLTAGYYSVTITDGACQIDLDSLAVQSPEQITILQEALVPPSCYGGIDGRIEIKVVGGTDPYQINWNDQSTDTIRDLLSAMTYHVSVEDAHGCEHSSSFQLDDRDSLEVVFASSPLQCYGDSNAVIETFVTGGQAPYHYQWSNGDTLANRSHLPAGTYQLTITDHLNCQKITSWTIQNPPSIQWTLDPQDPTCVGVDDGSITVHASGGTGNLLIEWEDQTIGDQRTALSSGHYVFTITDNQGCQATSNTISLTANQVITLTLDSLVNNQCEDSDQGAIYLTAIGGSGTLNYIWNNGETSSDIMNLPLGDYQLSISDTVGCELISPTYSIETPPSLQVDSLIEQVSCAKRMDGSIELSVSGGTQPYHYEWNTADTSSTLSGLDQGHYDVTITDDNNCRLTFGTQITEPDDLIVTIDDVNHIANCILFTPGEINISVSGGVPDYQYLWSNGHTNQDITITQTGRYDVTVTDAKGCTKRIKEQAIYYSDTTIAIQATHVQPITCYGANDAALGVEIINGSKPYNYNWSNGQNPSSMWTQSSTDTITDLGAGSYDLTVTDAHGCVVFLDTVSFDNPAPVSSSIDSLLMPECALDSNGYISIQFQGGEQPYELIWSNGAKNQVLYDLPQGIYYVTMTDANHCETTFNNGIELAPNVMPFTIELDSINNSRCAQLGYIQVQIAGQSTNLNYLWNTGDQTAIIDELEAGNYWLTVTDGNGCVAVSDTFEIVQESSQLSIGLNHQYDNTCFGDSLGEIMIDIHSGNPPFFVSWNNGDSSTLITNLPNGQYQVTIIDSDSCEEKSNPIMITSPMAMTANTSITNTSSNQQTGLIEINVLGGMPPYQYQWSNGALDSVSSGLGAGIYYCTISDHFDCQQVFGPYEVDIINSSTSLAANTAQLWPNPATDHFNLVVSHQITTEVWLENLTGQVIWSADTPTSPTQTLTNVPAGMYYLKYTLRSTKDQVYYRTFVVIR